VYVTVAPGAPTRMEMTPASSKFLVGSDNVVAITLRDSLNNISTGRYETLKLKIEGDASFVTSTGSSEKEMNISIIEGVAAATMRANGAGTVSLSAQSVANSFPAVAVNMTAIQNAVIDISLEDENNITVGDKAKQVNISIKDTSGNIIDGFDSYASLSFPSAMGKLSVSSTPIVNGKSTANILFYPGLLG